MKAKCPKCGIEGFLEIRGRSYRVKYYIGYIDNKRKYNIHTLTSNEIVGINGNQLLGINRTHSTFKSENKRGCRLVWSRLLASGVRDPGSNPGSPTKSPMITMLSYKDQIHC